MGYVQEMEKVGILVIVVGLVSKEIIAMRVSVLRVCLFLSNFCNVKSILLKYLSSVKQFLFALDPCDQDPCKNGGNCFRDGHGSYLCDCTSTGYTGRTCSSSKIFSYNNL